MSLPLKRYRFPPPAISEFSVPGHLDQEAHDFITQRQKILKSIKQHLQQAQARMKKYADRNRVEREFSPDDMVYLKLQPYRLAAFGLRSSLKLQTKFYGPFRILAKIGKVAYRLQLPSSVNIHPVFHVSQLKKHVGPTEIPTQDLPLVHTNGFIKTDPVAVLQTRQVPRNNLPVVQWLVQWANLPPEDATWEDASFMKGTFPVFYNTTVRAWFAPQHTP